MILKVRPRTQRLISVIKRNVVIEKLPSRIKEKLTEDEIGKIIRSIIPIKGIHYFDGKDGVNGIDGKNGKNGKDGKPGKNGLNGKDGLGVDENKIIKSLTKKLQDELGKLDVSKFIKQPPGTNPETLAKYGISRLRHGGGDIVQLYDLSSKLDGITKTFTIPIHRKITLVTSSDAPFFFRPTIDYTDTKDTITFDAGINAATSLLQGHSVGIQYIQ